MFLSDVVVLPYCIVGLLISGERVTTPTRSSFVNCEILILLCAVKCLCDTKNLGLNGMTVRAKTLLDIDMWKKGSSYM